MMFKRVNYFKEKTFTSEMGKASSRLIRLRYVKRIEVPPQMEKLVWEEKALVNVRKGWLISVLHTGSKKKNPTGTFIGPQVGGIGERYLHKKWLKQDLRGNNNSRAHLARANSEKKFRR